MYWSRGYRRRYLADKLKPPVEFRPQLNGMAALYRPQTSTAENRHGEQTGFDPEGVEVLCLLPPRFERSWPAMYEIRKEKRNPEKLQMLLSRMAEPLLTETASTEDVSSHGLRVRTEHAWKLGAHVIVESSAGELWGRARVVYCQTLPANTFAIGLELLARTGAWIMR